VTIRSSDGGSRSRHPSLGAVPDHAFAHPSEKLFANLLSLYGISWSYEPVEFPLEWNDKGQPIRAFRPDFYLHDYDLFIELTVLEQRLVTKKNQKVRNFRTLYPELKILVVYQRDFLAIMRQHELGSLSDLAA
jgi:hypothetical protein